MDLKWCKFISLKTHSFPPVLEAASQRHVAVFSKRHVALLRDAYAGGGGGRGQLPLLLFPRT